MRRVPLAPALLSLLSPAQAQVPALLSAPALLLESGYGEDGTPTPAWRAALAGLRGGPVTPSAPRVPTAGEAAWAAAIRGRAAHWPAEVAALRAPFEPLAGPAEIRLLVGLGDGEDAFSPEDRTVAFDVARLAALYGDATLPENGARLDRFFRHECTHVLQKAWLATHPYPARTPLRSALLDLWKEGQGNLHSLSARWRTPQGELTAGARAALDRLVPRLVARLAALAGASPEAAARLRAGLSTGPFEAKWGALPVALWLAEAQGREPGALRTYVTAGPEGIWELGARHLPEALRPVWRELQAAAQLTGQP